MTAYSLRARLLALWVLLLASAAATAYLMFGVYSQSTGVQVAQADIEVGRACREIIDRYAALVRGRRAGIAAEDLVGVVTAALAGFPGIEGGIWSASDGSMAYAYPTYEGTGPKTDLPAAEHDAIAALNAQVLRVDHAVSVGGRAAPQVLLLQGCALHGPTAGLTAWSMGRTHVTDGPTYTRFLAGLAFLAATVLGSAAFLGWFLYGFSGTDRPARSRARRTAPGRRGSAPSRSHRRARVRPAGGRPERRRDGCGRPEPASLPPSGSPRSAGWRRASPTRSETRSQRCA